MTDGPRRFYSLDALRGCAALAVVLNHWKHFSMEGTGEATWGRSESPFYSFLFPFYEHGWVAVDFFFTLSGFVFFWMYSERIARGEVGVGRFAVLRLSRLYPLHFATLCLVALLQAVHWRAVGDYAVYSENTPVQFLWHALFATGLVAQGGDSFNAPVWSVSVEMIMYAAFFAVCLRPWSRRPIALVGYVILGFALQVVLSKLGRGFASFFLGGLTHSVYAYAMRWSNQRGGVRAARLVLCSRLALLACLVCVLLQLRYEIFSEWAASGSAAGWAQDLGSTGQKILRRAPNIALLGLGFPVIVLSMGLLEALRGPQLKSLAVLGDWSYAAYLLHFPLQLALILACTALGIDRTVFQHPLSVPIFLALLLGLSQLSYRYFERPMQDLLRGR